MRPENQSWHEYITECNYDDEILSTLSQSVADEIETHKETIKLLYDKYGKYLIESYKPVYKRNFPKLVVQDKSPVFRGSNFSPYSFKLQCLVTGELSRWIKVDDYHIYGIFPNEDKNLGNYPKPLVITNKLKAISDYYKKEISNLMQLHYDTLLQIKDERIIYQANMRQNWFNRYNEYLNSFEWRNKRLEVIKYDGKKCLNCKTKQDKKVLQVHHMTYLNVGKEDLTELITLCTDCHNLVHSLNKTQRTIFEYNIMTNRDCGLYYQ
jgi:hypothetical protein